MRDENGNSAFPAAVRAVRGELGEPEGKRWNRSPFCRSGYEEK